MGKEEPGQSLSLQIRDLSDFPDCLLAVGFPKVNSPSFALVVNLSQGAFRYSEIMLDGQAYHLAVFAKSPPEAQRALILIKYAEGWKGFQVFARGRPLDNVWKLKPVLECYLNAANCTDSRAHCFKVIEDPFLPPEFGYTRESRRELEVVRIRGKPALVDEYLFPCTLILEKCKFSKGHPSRLEDQIQATGVEELADVCPLFDPGKFEKLGTKVNFKGGAG